MKRFLKYFIFMLGLFIFVNTNASAYDCSKYNSLPANDNIPEKACRKDSNCVWSNHECVSQEIFEKDKDDINRCIEYNTHPDYISNPEKACKSNKKCMWSNNYCSFNADWEKSQLEASKDEVYGCSYYISSTACEASPYYSCLWIKANNSFGGYCNVDKLQYVQCGGTFDIPNELPNLTSFFINLLKIATPIILIITSIITLIKAMMGSKEDEIKKATNSLIRKLIAAVMVFFIIYIVQFVIMKVADSSEADDISSCLSCFINNDCENNKYYKNNVGGEYVCYYLSGELLNGDGICPENNSKLTK